MHRIGPPMGWDLTPASCPLIPVPIPLPNIPLPTLPCEDLFAQHLFACFRTVCNPVRVGGGGGD